MIAIYCTHAVVSHNEWGPRRRCWYHHVQSVIRLLQSAFQLDPFLRQECLLRTKDKYSCIRLPKSDYEEAIVSEIISPFLQVSLHAHLRNHVQRWLVSHVNGSAVFKCLVDRSDKYIMIDGTKDRRIQLIRFRSKWKSCIRWRIEPYGETMLVGGLSSKCTGGCSDSDWRIPPELPGKMWAGWVG